MRGKQIAWIAVRIAVAATVLVAVLSSPFGEYLWLLAALAPLVLAAVSIACVLFAIGN